jgi:hypothetical protein
MMQTEFYLGFDVFTAMVFSVVKVKLSIQHYIPKYRILQNVLV